LNLMNSYMFCDLSQRFAPSRAMHHFDGKLPEPAAQRQDWYYRKTSKEIYENLAYA